MRALVVGSLFGLSLLAGASDRAVAAGSEADRKALEAAELGFAASVREHDRAKFAAFIDEQAAFVQGEEVVSGRAAVVESWAPLLAPDAPYFEWHPTIVELTGEGTVGLTRGPWTSRRKDAQGQEVERHGTFTSVWRKGADGAWKIVFDAGCPPCAAPK